MKKLIVMAISVVFLFLLIPVSAQQNSQTIKILAIGNSYSNNATQYVDEITASLGIKTETYSLYYPGCSIQQHVNFYNNASTVYALATKGENLNWQINTMQKAFALHNYNYITIQQGSTLCDAFFSYWTQENPWVNNLYDIISENQPDAQIKMHQTWSLCNEKATEKRPNFAVPWESSTAMFNQIESCYNRAAEKVGLTKNDIIKSGKAIQLAKDKYGYGDIYNTKENGKLIVAETLANNALYADNLSHLNHRGRYLASLVFVESLLGIDSREVTFVPEVLDEADCKLLRRIAHEAVTGEVSYEQGDINGDGTVNASDLALLKKVVAGLTTESDEVKNTNVDENLGTPNAADLALLKKIVAGLV